MLTENELRERCNDIIDANKGFERDNDAVAICQWVLDHLTAAPGGEVGLTSAPGKEAGSARWDRLNAVANVIQRAHHDKLSMQEVRDLADNILTAQESKPPTAETPDADFYRKKTLIHAVQWRRMGDHPAVKILPSNHPAWNVPEQAERLGWLETMEGGLVVHPGYWIATGSRGEHWPIDPAVFAETYEPAIRTPTASGVAVDRERLIDKIWGVVIEDLTIRREINRASAGKVADAPIASGAFVQVPTREQIIDGLSDLDETDFEPTFLADWFLALLTPKDGEKRS